MYLDARKFIKDLITSCIGMFGPGCGPTQLCASSGVTITGGTVFVDPVVGCQLLHTDDSVTLILVDMRASSLVDFILGLNSVYSIFIE